MTMMDFLMSVIHPRGQRAPDLVAFKAATAQKDDAMTRFEAEADNLKNFVTSIKGPKPQPRSSSKRAK